jgi:CheY-like chemotaxis protein
MRVLIADDHKLIVEGVKRALDEDPDFEVVGECSSGSQVLPMVGRTNPDLVLLDLRMPGADGLACLSRIRKQYPDVKVVVLSVSTDENVIQTVLKRGASAFIVKSINPIDLPSALRQAVDGTVYSAIGLPDPGESAARAAGLTDGDPRRLGARALERGDRQGAVGGGTDGQVPPHEHLSQARRLEPHRGRPPRLPERARREPDRRPLI